MQDKTIAALSTPPGIGGIAVIRISGEGAVEICDKIFKGKEKLSGAATHTVHYGHIIDFNGERVDEVLVTLMRAPRSYTCEDVVEISTHGGMVASKRVLELLIKAGAVPAQPGEFTKRAFLNGRIDLSGAEGVIDIINAKTELSQKNALSQAEGALFREINGMRSELVHLAAEMQVAIDYPDEDLEDVTAEDIIAAFDRSIKKTDKLIAGGENGKILREGIRTAIVGRPNVGKSSLLNCLAREERAIVTDIAGTTRDVIEESVSLNGVPLVLLDTAGIRDTADTVEKIGVERSKRAIDEADLIIVLLDSTCELTEEDRQLLDLTENKNRIIAANKTDVGSINDEAAIAISAKTGEGIEVLAEKIKELYNLGSIGQSDSVIVTNLRHLASLEGARTALLRASASMQNGMPQDIAALDLNEAIDALGEITGDTVSEAIVSEIFHSFCVGK